MPAKRNSEQHKILLQVLKMPAALEIFICTFLKKLCYEKTKIDFQGAV